MRKKSVILLILVVTLVVVGWGFSRAVIGKYNTIQAMDESVKATWSQVVNVYKRRADLIPNLVNTVRGYAAHEQQTLTQVIEARAKATNMNVIAGDAQSLQAFQAAQNGLQNALARLMVVVERYPDLKASQHFRDLQIQLEGTENRITVERQRYIESVQSFNTYIRMFPTNLVALHFGYQEKPNFTVENEQEIKDAPVVDFGK